MKYAVIKCVNGNYEIASEGWTAPEKAKVNYHTLCASLWNDPSTLSAYVAIVDEQLDVVDKCKEYIFHEPAPEPEPTPEPEQE